MKLELDHIVHLIKRDPNEVVELLRSKNIPAVIGGHHEKWGTYNSLIYLASSYIEFLAVEHEDIAKKSDNPLIKQLIQEGEKGEGIIQLCFRTDNIQLLKDTLTNKGYQTSSIFGGSRIRNDGKTIQWKMLFLHEDNGVHYPFFIEWNQPDEERFKDLRELGFLSERFSNTIVDSIEFVVSDIEEIQTWSLLFDAPISTTAENLLAKTVSLTVGECKLNFTQPLTSENPFYQNLQETGSRPIKINLTPTLGKELNLLGSIYS